MKTIQQNLDIDFVKLLNKIKGKRLIKDGLEISFRQLTKEIANNPKFLKLIEEDLANEKNSYEINIRLDKKRLWEN